MADPAESPFTGDQFYDAGAKGCGEGPLDTIAGIVRKMQSGQTLVIHATDPSVAVDLAAWARMTGNTLLDQQRQLLSREPQINHPARLPARAIPITQERFNGQSSVAPDAFEG